MHSRNENVFVEGGMFVMDERKSSGDYHEEMIGDVFKAWFSDIVKLLPKNSVVFTENASYHNMKQWKIPTTNSNKVDIIEWLPIELIWA